MMNIVNSHNGHTSAHKLWSEARNAEGRVYYYNTVTKVTQWTKPEELMTPAERALSSQPWKEYTAEGGRKYWYNTETKQSSWEMPEVYKIALAKEAASPTPASSYAPLYSILTDGLTSDSVPTFVAGGGFTNTSNEHLRDREPLTETRQITYGNDVNGSRAQVFVPANTDPDYNTFEEAEAAFMKLLRRNNVDPDSNWEQTMRSIIKDPQYRSLKDPKDRKAAFEKYAVEVRIQEKDRAKERMEKLRKDFALMLKSHPEIKHYTRWKTARPIIERETIFRSSNNDDERRQLFEDYIIELKKSNAEQEIATRKTAMNELVEIIRGLDLQPFTRWTEAQGIITSNQRFQSDKKFQSLSKSDLLNAFENHIKLLEKSFNDSRQLLKIQKFRRERQNRDRFTGLLQELKSKKHIKAGTKWNQIYPLIKDEERYTVMLGQPGSTPLDLFWDMVEEEERALRTTRNDVLDVLDDKRFEVESKTHFDEFLEWMKSDRRTANIDQDALSLIFQRLVEKASRRKEDDKHQAERIQRRVVDALRSYIKHLQPPVRIEDTFEKVLPRIERSEEYNLVPTDELRRSAFDKVIKRLKEKEEDAEKDRTRRRERVSVDRSTYRDRERGERSRRYKGRHDLASGSPEPDAYEADRRKATADREKNYRRGGADSLLSPIRRGERDRDREIDLDRPHRSRREAISYYERERRERETEREKLYRRRGDPRGSIDELPYGDERPSISKRRRIDSDVESVSSSRVPKRRRDLAPREQSPTQSRERRNRTRTPPNSLPHMEEAAVHSGSEEGEIEEG